MEWWSWWGSMTRLGCYWGSFRRLHRRCLPPPCSLVDDCWRESLRSYLLLSQWRGAWSELRFETFIWLKSCCCCVLLVWVKGCLEESWINSSSGLRDKFDGVKSHVIPRLANLEFEYQLWLLFFSIPTQISCMRYFATLLFFKFMNLGIFLKIFTSYQELTLYW